MAPRCVLTLTQVKTEDTLELSAPASDTVMVRHFVSLGMTDLPLGGNPFSPEVVGTEVGSTNTKEEQN